MSFNRQQALGFFIIFYLSFTTLGYAAEISSRSHPELRHTKDIKVVGFLTPDIKIYELTAGGVRELRDDWSTIGKENVMNALIKGLKEKQLEIKTLTVEKDLQDELEDIQALYRAVATSIRLHTYGEHSFPEKQKNFDYSIGSIENILTKYGVNALIFVYGRDEISTGGRKALTAAGVIAGALTGVVVIPRAGTTAVSVALVNKSGSILWFNVKGSGAGYDLREPESTSEFITEMLSDFPKFEK